jgi:hypothetical protein
MISALIVAVGTVAVRGVHVKRGEPLRRIPKISADRVTVAIAAVNIGDWIGTV